jgi:hypothetical protein
MVIILKEQLKLHQFYTWDFDTEVAWQDAAPEIIFVEPPGFSDDEFINKKWTYTPRGRWIVRQRPDIDYWTPVSHSSLGFVRTPSVWTLSCKVNNEERGILTFVSGKFNGTEYYEDG